MKKLFSILLIGAMLVSFVACDQSHEPNQEDTNNTPSSNAPKEGVDLGLPSGMLWAPYNLGATAPEEYGNYYAWGEIETHETNYYWWWNNYKWCEYIDGNGTEPDKIHLTKYFVESTEDSGWNLTGVVDNKTTLDLEDDAAYVAWGKDWRIPTAAQQKELLDNCTWEWTTLNKVNGCKVTGPNGNSIFLPALGIAAIEGPGNIMGLGVQGGYNSSSIYEGHADEIYMLLVFEEPFMYTNSRCYGYGIRPVYSPSK